MNSTILTMDTLYNDHLILFNRNGRAVSGDADFFPEDATVESMGLEMNRPGISRIL